MGLVAARTGRGRELGQRLKALLAGFAVFQAHIDPADIHLRRSRLDAQCPPGEGRFGHEAAQNRKYRQGRTGEDRQPQRPTPTTRMHRCRLIRANHFSFPPGPETLTCDGPDPPPYPRSFN